MRFFAVAVALVSCLYGEDWPQFRGPGGQGHSIATELPLRWSDTTNVVWKADVPGRGWSSPSIAGDLVWLTTAAPVADSQNPNARSLRVMAFSKADGTLVRDVEVFRLDDAGKQHDKNSFASPTPLIEGDRVYVHYGRLGTAALTVEGRILWKRQLDYAYQHGSGPSPVLYKNLLIIPCDGTDVQYVVAFDKTTGEVAWKVHRQRPGAMAYATPLVIETGQRALLIAPSAFRTVAYEPDTGRELWSVSYGDGFSNVPRPVFAHGLVYLCTGFYKPELLAVRPETGEIVWRYGRGVPLTPSPIVVGDEIYAVSDNGILSCLNARTGEPRYQQRLSGNFSASPVAAAGRIYFQSEEGETIVLAPGPEFRELARSQMPEQTLASLAVSEASVYLRTASKLYRIGKTGGSELQ